MSERRSVHDKACELIRGFFTLAEYDSRQAAEAAVARDPLVIAGAAVYDIREIAIGKNQLEKL